MVLARIVLLVGVLALGLPDAGAGAPAALPDLTLQDQEGRTLQLSSLRNRVVIVVYGGRAGVDEHSAWGKRLDAELRQLGVYQTEDAEADRPVRILAIAEMGGIPEMFRPIIRTAIRPGVEKGYSLWLDWDNQMNRLFGGHDPHSTVLVADRGGTVHLVVSGPPSGAPLQAVLDLLKRLVL